MLPSPSELENKMSNRNWCDKHPHDCARFQKQQEREWLRTHIVAFRSTDIVVALAIAGMFILAIL